MAMAKAATVSPLGDSVQLPMQAVAAPLAPVSFAFQTTPATWAELPNAKTHSAKATLPTTITATDHAEAKAWATGLLRLRTCESGGNYREASGNGYYGAYQFNVSTWRSLGLTGLPDYASHELQDAAVTRLHTLKGWGPWPVCSYTAGLR